MGERAPVWGLGKPGFHLADAAECCAACQAHVPVSNPDPDPNPNPNPNANPNPNPNPNPHL